MENAQQELIVAEVNLNRARAVFAEEQRTANIEAYKQAKREGRAVEDEANAAIDKYFALQHEVDAKEEAIRSVNHAIDELIAADPDDEDFATDEEEELWGARWEALKAQRTTLQGESYVLSVNRNHARMEAIKLEQAVERYRFAVRNLKNKIADPKLEGAVRGWEGGLSGVV